VPEQFSGSSGSTVDTVSRVSEEFLTVAEAAELLKLNTQTIYNWISDGSLAHTRAGRQVRIRREDFQTLTHSQDDNAETDLLTVAEVAELLKLNQQTIRNWIDAGTLKSIRVGRRIRVHRSDVDAMLQVQPRTTAENQDRPTASDFWDGLPVGEALAPE
jgi:excisionase family DNA binding protein